MLIHCFDLLQLLGSEADFLPFFFYSLFEEFQPNPHCISFLDLLCFYTPLFDAFKVI